MGAYPGCYGINFLSSLPLCFSCLPLSSHLVSFHPVSAFSLCLFSSLSCLLPICSVSLSPLLPFHFHFHLSSAPSLSLVSLPPNRDISLLSLVYTCLSACISTLAPCLLLLLQLCFCYRLALICLMSSHIVPLYTFILFQLDFIFSSYSAEDVRSGNNSSRELSIQH